MTNKDLRRVLIAAINELDVMDAEHATSGTKPHELKDAVPSNIPTEKPCENADTAKESNDTAKTEVSKEERVKLALELLGGGK